MPFYNFTCTSCGKTEEHLVKMDTKEVDCKECGEKAEKDLLKSMFFASTGLPNGHNSIRGNLRRK